MTIKDKSLRKTKQEYRLERQGTLCRLEDEAAGQIPVAYVVRAAADKLTEDQVIQFVNRQVAPYKKIRRVSFISAIPRSAAGKILRKQLISQSKQQMPSRL